MKILFLTPWYPDDENPNHGTFVRDQALAIARNHEVRVVCAKIDYKQFGLSTLIRNDTTYDVLKESRLSLRHSLPVFNQLNFFIRIAHETLKIARAFQPDVIHGNIGYPGALWAMMVSRLLKKPYVVTEHTRITNNFRSIVHRHLSIYGLRSARAIIAVSRWHADEIHSYTGRTPVVIPNVIRFSDIPEPEQYPDTPELRIGFLGGLNTPVKGLYVLLRAAASLQGNFTLHIGGDGTLLNQYKRQAEELNISGRCIFYGRIRQEDVKTFMRKLHIFVSASRWETFGIAMVEALASGCARCGDGQWRLAGVYR